MVVLLALLAVVSVTMVTDCNAQAVVYLWVSEPTSISVGIEALDSVCSANLTGSRALLCTPDTDVRQLLGEGFDVVTRNGSGWDLAHPVATAGNVLSTLFSSSVGLGTTVKTFAGATANTVAVTGCYSDGVKYQGWMCGRFDTSSGSTLGGTPNVTTQQWLYSASSVPCNSNSRIYCIGGNYQRNGSQAFETIWRTTTANQKITLPVPSSSNLTVKWDQTAIDHSLSHTYSTPGLHYVSIYGPINHFRFNFGGDAAKLVDISSWGTEFKMGPLDDYAFAGCTNLSISASRATQPVMLPGTTLKGMFKNSSVNSPLSWDLTNVVSLDSMFAFATQFNQPLNFTNTQFVTSMRWMFRGASSFNQAVSFDTSHVQSMNEMFAFATSFNRTVNFSSVAAVTDMEHMFLNVSVFEQDLRSWDTDAVANCSQFCYSCGLPSFPLCEPCASGRQLHGNTTHCNVPFTLSSSNLSATVLLPPEVLNDTLIANITPGNNDTVSDSLVSLKLEDSTGHILNVSHLPHPVVITFTMKIPLDLHIVTQCQGTEWAQAPVLPECTYYNETTLQWETDGCSVAGYDDTHVQCKCNHFTLFGVSAPKHNKLVPAVFLRLTPENIDDHPTGIITVIIILAFLLVLFAAAWRRDRTEVALYEQIKLSKHEKWAHFVAKQGKAKTWKEVKVSFQKRHTWFSLIFRKSGTSFRSVDRTFVALLSIFASMSMSAVYHAQDNGHAARAAVVIISGLVCVIPAQVLTLLFVRTGQMGFYEEWEQATSHCDTAWMAYRFPEEWRKVWRVLTLVAVLVMIIYVLAMSVNFDHEPYYFCRGEAATAWVSTWLLGYAVSVLLFEPARIVAVAVGRSYAEPLKSGIVLRMTDVASKTGADAVEDPEDPNQNEREQKEEVEESEDDKGSKQDDPAKSQDEKVGLVKEETPQQAATNSSGEGNLQMNEKEKTSLHKTRAEEEGKKNDMGNYNLQEGDVSPQRETRNSHTANEEEEGESERGNKSSLNEGEEAV